MANKFPWYFCDKKYLILDEMHGNLDIFIAQKNICIGDTRKWVPEAKKIWGRRQEIFNNIYKIKIENVTPQNLLYWECKEN